MTSTPFRQSKVVEEQLKKSLTRLGLPKIHSNESEETLMESVM